MASRKRDAAAAGASGESGKRSKSASGDDAGAALDWAALAAGDGSKLMKCTVDELKQYCRDNSLTIGGKKADLVERVRAHVTGSSS